jgi:tetratricopeptide (TPR) repeat protein
MAMVRPMKLLIFPLIAGVLFLLAGCGKSAERKYAEASARLDSVQNLYSAGRYDESLMLARQTQALFAEIQNDTGIALGSLFIGLNQRQLGGYDSAVAYIRQAVERFHATAEKRLERKANIALADFDNALGVEHEALTLSANAATEARVFSDRADEYRAIRILAQAHHALGHYDLEAEKLEELIHLDSIVYGGRKGMEVFETLFRSAVAGGNAGQVDSVVRRWKTTMRTDVAVCQADYWLGRWQERTGKLDSAFRSYSRAIESLNKVTAPVLQAEIWSALGGLSFRQRRYENARSYFANALPIARKFHRAGQAVLLELALVATDGQLHPGENFAGLIQRAERQTDTARIIAFRRAEALGLYLTGEFAELLGDRAKASHSYRAAWQIAGCLPKDRAMFDDLADVVVGADGNDWIDRLLKLYCAGGSADSAFAFAEERNRRELVEFAAHCTIKTADADLAHRIADVQWAYNAEQATEAILQSEFTDTVYFPAVRHEALSHILPELKKKTATALASLAGLNKNFAQVFTTDGLSVRDIRTSLPAGSALLEMILEENVSYLLIVKNDTVLLRKTAVGKTNILSLVREYTKNIAETRLTAFGLRTNESASTQRLNEIAGVLSGALVNPLAADIHGVQKLYVVLPAECSWLPFQTLRTADGPVGLRINVSYLPSAAALLFTQPPEHWTRQVVGMGHRGTTDWDVEYEVKDIRSFYDKAPMLFDTMATLSHLLPMKYDALQMTAEFHLDAEVPDNSHFILSDGRVASGTREIPLGDFFMIPAPQTLFFSNITGEPGTFRRYVPYLLLANGTRTIIASLWQGDRRTKKAFGEGFYTNLFTGSTAGEAYQRSIVDMGKGEMNQPQRWGMYVQYGR